MSDQIQEPELPMEDLPPAGRKLAKHGTFTGESVDPATGELIVTWFTQGASISDLSKTTGFSRNTISAYLLTEHKLSVEQMRQQLGKSGMIAAQLVVNRVIDEVDSMPKAGLALAGKLMTDIAGSMTGSAPVVIEHNHRVTVAPDAHAAQLANIMHSLGMGSPVPEIRPISAQPEPIEIIAEVLPKPDLVATNPPMDHVNTTN